MQLKKYQERVCREVRTYLQALADEQRDNPRHAAQDAWESATGLRDYRERRTGAGRDLPTFCLKVPTGGGKTLLATQIVGEAYRTILAARNGAGLVLWVVPSDQIYRDTLGALRDREHFYRQSLQHAVSRPVEVWEKHEIARLTPGQLATTLNVLVVKLQGTSRQDKESLKFFQDSGGNIVMHFPAEDDPAAHRELRERIPNLEMLEDDPATGRHLAKTSIGNLVRLCEPLVILDEGHKATSKLARQTIEGFNPQLVVELSATPPDDANVLSRVSGQELLDEEMIKLPINIASSGQQSWKNCLTQAREKREELAAKALEHYRTGQRLIRPIVLVQVERTGKDQRGADVIHSEDAREYLVQRLGIPAERVRVKSSERDDIEGIDLLAEDCPVEWIITKSALQEGWDCPFAYILVSLNNTRSQLAMTQLVGRVLRQPFAEKTGTTELDESYVYCLRAQAREVIKDVRAALLKEGYEGSAASVVDRSGDTAAGAPMRTAAMRPEFSTHYKRPFAGRIFLPRFCVRQGEGYRRMDYFRHLLARVDVDQFNFAEVESWDFAPELREATDQFYRVSLGESPLDMPTETPALVQDTDADIRAWLVASLGIEWISAKQLRRVVNHACDRLVGIEGQLARVRFRLLERLHAFIQAQTDRLTEAVFKDMYERDEIFFYLEECLNCTFEIPSAVQRRHVAPLRREDHTDLQKNLFDFQPEEENEYERDVALFLDRHPKVLWWYRNIVGPEEFDIQGYRRPRIRPDFVVQQADGDSPRPTVLVVESKGKHLKGSADTEYKRDVASYFEGCGREVTWQELGEGFDRHRFRFQVLDEGDYADRSWRDDLERLLGS
jgi:type III restriction enzyme